MSAHLARAQLLLEQSRPADAEREAGLAVAQEPDHPGGHALLALSRMEQQKYGPALEAAQTALGLAPDYAHYHYIHALVLLRSDRPKDALAVLQEAIRLEPDDADYFSLLAAIHLQLGRWEDALTAAGQALALKPEHTEAANFRAMALVRLNRKDEALATVGRALERDPESAFSHANQGWNCLHQNDPKRALVHFKEALRLAPNLDYAREGMVEALKAHNPVYRVMLAYFLWMSRLGSGARWAVVLGILVGRNILSSLSKSAPTLAPYITPVLYLAAAFVLLTWIAQPLFNLLLLLHPDGRHALSKDQRRLANLVGLLFFPGLAAIVASFFTTQAWLIAGIVAILLIIPVYCAATSRRGAWRWGMGLAAVALAGCGFGGVFLAYLNQRLGLSLLSWFFAGIFVVSLVSNFGRE
ncbi:MAG TPA: tetratricopeptide repeat protein [Lacunisphaera sp.]|nr:tetratricopeptide repeat protein [Lacunisphaera sp.]